MQQPPSLEKDLVAARASRIKQKEKEQKDEEKKRQTEAVRAARAKAKSMAKADGKVSLSLSCLTSFLQLPFDKFKRATVFDDIASLGGIDGSVPFLVASMPDLSNFMSQQDCQGMVAVFVPSFQATVQAKTTGRASRGFQPAVKAAALRGIMLQAAPFCDIILPTDVANDRLSSLQNVVHFGYTESMIYTGLEFNALGQLRYHLQGRRQVRAAPFDKLEQYFSEEAGKALSVAEVVRCFGDLDADGFKVLSENVQVIAFEQGPKQMSYVPSGWVISDQTVGGCIVIGLRTMAANKSSLGPFKSHLQCIITNPSPEHANFELMAKDFMQFVDTGVVPKKG